MHLRFLKVFPLELVLFEEEELHLHIFEPRYQRLINHCLQTRETFGIPTVHNGEITAYGCEARLLRIDTVHKGGEMDIACEGIARFQIHEFIPSNNPYEPSGALTQLVEFTQNEDKELNIRIADLLAQLYQQVKADKEMPDSGSFSIVPFLHKCGLSLEQEIELSALETMEERQLFILNHLKNYVNIMERIGRMKEKIELNGHFKNIAQNW